MAAIVFFSRDGSTRRAAQILSEQLDATLVELEEAKARTGFIASGFRAKTKRSSQLAGDPWADVRGENTIILAAPIWAGSGNPAMNGFLDQADLSDKTVYLLTLQADPKRGSSGTVIDHYRSRVEHAGGTVAGSRAITGASPGKTAGEEQLRAALEGWADQIAR